MTGGGYADADSLWAEAVLELLAGRKHGLLAAGVECLEAALAAGPSEDGDAADSERQCFLGTLRMHHGRMLEAAACFESAIALNALDRLPHLELVLLLEGLGRFDDARTAAERALAAGGHWVNAWQRPPLFVLGLRSQPHWSRDDFAWVGELEAAHTVIKAELDELLLTVNFPRVGEGGRAEQDDLIVAPGGEWREYVIFGTDASSAATGEHVPQTRAILERLLPGAVSMARIGAGEIIFSALHPGTRLLPHCASSNNRLTCHLGLSCPHGPRLRVGPEWATWEEGRCLLFDDSFEHEVVHDGTEVRIVLLIRFWHPDLPEVRWMPTLEAGMEEFETMQRRRSLPPLSPAAAKHLEARRTSSRPGAAVGCEAVALGPAVVATSPSPLSTAAVSNLHAAVDADNELE